MTDLGTAFSTINNQVIELLNPLINDGTINEIVFGGKSRGAPKPPSLGVIPDEDLDCDSTTLGSTGNVEAWFYPLRIRGLFKEMNNPVDGYNGAFNITSKARNLILAQRQLQIPLIVRKVDSSRVRVVPFPLNKKMTLYGADAHFKIFLVVNNK